MFVFVFVFGRLIVVKRDFEDAGCVRCPPCFVKHRISWVYDWPLPVGSGLTANSRNCVEVELLLFGYVVAGATGTVLVESLWEESEIFVKIR